MKEVMELFFSIIHTLPSVFQGKDEDLKRMLQALQEIACEDKSEVYVAQCMALKYLTSIMSTNKESSLILSFTIEIFVNSGECWKTIAGIKETSNPIFIKVWASNLAKSVQTFVKEVDEYYNKSKSPYAADILLHDKSPIWLKYIKFCEFYIEQNKGQEASIEYIKSIFLNRRQRESNKNM